LKRIGPPSAPKLKTKDSLPFLDADSASGGQVTQIHTDKSATKRHKKHKGIPASLVFSVKSASKASFVANFRLRPQGQLRWPYA
jgi:hypothetical protein